MRYGFLACLMLLGASPAMSAQVSIGISIGLFPQLTAIPGYPVYYAPAVDSNYFFYDGSYWVFQDDNWYTATWYNGPWDRVDPVYVPVYLLQVPVRYYRRPPAYFRGWQADAQPRWADHWGRDWAQRRSDWNRPAPGPRPAPAPLPTYQRQYSGTHYPPATQQRSLQDRNYRYQPREPVVSASAPHPPVLSRKPGPVPRPAAQPHQPAAPAERPQVPAKQPDKAKPGSAAPQQKVPSEQRAPARDEARDRNDKATEKPREGDRRDQDP